MEEAPRLNQVVVNYNAEEDWTQYWEAFDGPSDWSWGLFNIGYMF